MDTGCHLQRLYRRFLENACRGEGVSEVRPEASTDRLEIDYTIDLPCEPRRIFGKQGLLDRLRSFHGTSVSDESIGGTIAAGMEAEFELRPLAFHCIGCPANASRGSYGCYGALKMPISAAAEEWLFRQLPRRLRPKKDASPHLRQQMQAAGRLIARLDTMRLTGKIVDERHRGGELLQRKRPLRRKYGFWFRRTTLSTSQLFELLFLRERLRPDDAELVLRALGVWESGGKDEDGLPLVVYNAPAEDDDEDSVAELKDFLLTLTLACSTSSEIRIFLQEKQEPKRDAA
jgi:hypothetical protein